VSEWYERPYKGGPMVGPAWPRSLYPPDAKPGHTPSENGDDVKAVKRTLWRLGRWPGPASKFDRAYSNAIAHGKTGGNVGDSGVAGFQRQMKIEPTGWIGEKTANAMRSALVPEGKPNAGQPGMDATAISLMEKAVAKYAKAEGTVRERALAKAISQLGVKESPYGSNEVKYTSWYQMVGPWCAMFCTWCFELAAQELGKDSPSFVKGSYYAYVPYVVADGRAKRRGLSIAGEVKPGDLVAYNWDGSSDSGYDHIGIFEKWTGGRTFTAIEGNTSTSSDSNGGQVQRRTRDAQGQATTFIRVAEP